MPVIEISKIQIRRGDQADLLPSSLAPGEFGMAKDTGRLFLGADPNDTGLFADRSVTPFENIEVLTEASIDTFARLYDRMYRTTGPVGLAEGDLNRKPYMTATLAASTSAWTSLQVERIDPTTGLFTPGALEDTVLSETSSVGALIEYFLCDNTHIIRSGELRIIHDGNLTTDEANLIDETTSRCEVPTSSFPITSDTAYLSGIRFRAFRLSSGAGTRIRLEYKNSTTSAYTVQLRFMTAIPVTAPTGGPFPGIVLAGNGLAIGTGAATGGGAHIP
jgi:hypothetical protein